MDPYDRDAPQREHSLHEVFNGLRWIVRAGPAWRMMPHDLPPWYTVYQQSQKEYKALILKHATVQIDTVEQINAHAAFRQGAT